MSRHDGPRPRAQITLRAINSDNKLAQKCAQQTSAVNAALGVGAKCRMPRLPTLVRLTAPPQLLPPGASWPPQPLAVTIR